MKQIYTCLLVLLVVSCQKENFISPGKKLSFSDSAFQYLRSELYGPDYERLDIKSWQILKIRNEETGIKIFEKGTTGHFILLQKKAGGFSGNRATITGLNTSKQRSGTILLETLDRKFLKKYVVENNRVTGEQNSPNGAVTANFSGVELRESNRTNSRQNTKVYEMPEVVIVAYKPAASEDYFSLFWLLGGSGGGSDYFYYYTSDLQESGGGGGGDANGAVAAPETYSPDKPITDVKPELKCFTNNASSTYTITVNVNQPVPGTRDVIDPFANFPVGHTYLTLQQNNPDGSSIIRNVGFYPKNTVKPGSTTDASTFGEDSGTPFDVSLKITVSGSEFSTVINGLIFQQSKAYDLDVFNCTNSVINVLKPINVRLPETTSRYPLFNGSNPADLGEDIKELNLDKFSAESGGKKMVRTVSNANTQTPPAKAGGC